MTKIVLADDEKDILETTAELLRLSGFEVTPVQDAAKVLDTLHREHPQILLQDCAMPGLDVDRLVDDIRHDPSLRAMPILLFTGSVNAKSAAQRLHVEGFIEKPFDFERLRRRIDRTLAAGVQA